MVTSVDENKGAKQFHLYIQAMRDRGVCPGKDKNLEKPNASLESKKQKRNIYWGKNHAGLRPEGRGLREGSRKEEKWGWLVDGFGVGNLLQRLVRRWKIGREATRDKGNRQEPCWIECAGMQTHYVRKSDWASMSGQCFWLGAMLAWSSCTLQQDFCPDNNGKDELTSEWLTPHRITKAWGAFWDLRLTCINREPRAI